jgi:hypothetical protein
MRNYSVTGYVEEQKKLFSFLITEYGFALSEERRTAFSYITDYRRRGLRVHLNYDTKDNFFYFVLIKGEHTIFPNDSDKENIKPLLALFKKYEPDLDMKRLLPDDKQYLESLKRTAQLLQKYGDRVLRGEEWI